MQIDSFDTINSTNDHARDHANSYYEDAIIVARRQLHGKGRGENRWHSETGCNLTFSVLVNVMDVELADSFIYSKAISCAIVEYLKRNNITGNIKWPNDILVGEEKICGILIEHIIDGAKFNKSILGVGLNVNQVKFEIEGAKPTSMALKLNKEFDLEEEIIILSEIISEKLNFVHYFQHDIIHNEYMNNLLGDNSGVDVIIDSKKETAQIDTVANDGMIHLKFTDESIKGYYMDDIKIL